MSFYCQELPYFPDAARYYAAMADLPCSVWLDSGGMARFDILTAAPHHTRMWDEQTCGDPYAALRDELGATAATVADVPFAGGALGYWSYDLARSMMSLSCIAEAGERLPVMAVGIYDWALVLDHQEHTARLVSHLRYPETVALLPQILQRLQAPSTQHPDSFSVQGKIRCNFTRESYSEAFARIQGYLQAGDCYQVNLAQRFSADATGDALGAYLKLRKLSPAPYSAYLNFPQVQILCASPERFISVNNGLVETRPIKGTRPPTGR